MSHDLFISANPFLPAMYVGEYDDLDLRDYLLEMKIDEVSEMDHQYPERRALLPDDEFDVLRQLFATGAVAC